MASRKNSFWGSVWCADHRGNGACCSESGGIAATGIRFRDEKMPDPSDSEKADLNRPSKQLSINSVPVSYPKYPTAVIKMKPLERQFWRVLNASADTYLELSVLYDGKRQNLGIGALDGVPLHYGEPGAEDYSPERTDVFLPPGSRAEFIITGPPAGVSGVLQTARVFR
jgi:hypothetical protein